MLLARCGAMMAAAVAAVTVAAPAGAVVGGQAANATNYPWLGAVGSPMFFIRPSGQFCGAALIAPDRVVTGAHCVAPMRWFPQILRVTFGRSNLNTHDGETVGVRSVWINPAFYETQFQSDTVEHNDTAVLTLTRPVRRPVVPIAPVHGSAATVIGWGSTSTSELDVSNAQLQSATIPMVPDRVCAAAYGPSFDPRDMTCAGSPKADTGSFDSGGPMLVDGKLVALTSWASGVARPGYPGVYARLDKLPDPLP